MAVENFSDKHFSTDELVNSCHEKRMDLYRKQLSNRRSAVEELQPFDSVFTPNHLSVDQLPTGWLSFIILDAGGPVDCQDFL